MHKYWAFVFFSWLTAHTPRRIGYTLAAIIGDIYYIFFRKQRFFALRNTQRVLGVQANQARIKRVCRATFRNYGKYMFDFLRLAHLNREHIFAQVSTVGNHYLVEAQERGKGSIIVGAHFGNWDVGGMVLASWVNKVYALVDTFDPPVLDKLVQGTRERNGIKVIPVDGSLRKIYEALKRNEVVCLLIDIPMAENGVPVQLFGHKACFPSGPAAIAVKTDASVFYGYFARQPGDLHFYGGVVPIDFPKTGQRHEDIQNLTQLLANQVEEVVRRHPDQWYIFRPLWSDHLNLLTKPELD